MNNKLETLKNEYQIVKKNYDESKQYVNDQIKYIDSTLNLVDEYIKEKNYTDLKMLIDIFHIFDENTNSCNDLAFCKSFARFFVVFYHVSEVLKKEHNIEHLIRLKNKFYSSIEGYIDYQSSCYNDHGCRSVYVDFFRNLHKEYYQILETDTDIEKRKKEIFDKYFLRKAEEEHYFGE